MRGWDDRRLLETARLRVEPLTIAHAEPLFQGLSDPRIYTYIPQLPPSSVDELTRRFDVVQKGCSADGSEEWLNWAVALRDGTYIGRLEATVHALGLASIAYIIFPRYWRQGYGKEGMRAVLSYLAEPPREVRVAHAEIDKRNTASVALVRSLGFARADLRPENMSTDDELYELNLRS